MSKIKETEYSSGSGVIGDDTLEDADELEMDNVAIQTKNKRKPKVYEFYQFFNSVEAAEQIIAADFLDSKWKIQRTTENVKSLTRWYHCSKGSKAKNETCQKVVQMVINSST